MVEAKRRLSDMPADERAIIMENRIMQMHVNDLERRLRAAQSLLTAVVFLLTEQGACKLDKVNFDIFEIPVRPHLRKEKM